MMMNGIVGNVPSGEKQKTGVDEVTSQPDAICMLSLLASVSMYTSGNSLGAWLGLKSLHIPAS